MVGHALSHRKDYFMKATLLNIKNFHSNKKDKDYTVLTILRPITPSERDRQGYIGVTLAEEVFAPEEQVGTFSQKDIDHEIDLQYDIIGGKAVLNKIVVN